MNQKPFISIIVPVYNVENYLRACVDSILCQSFGDYELILIDDGSTDGCPAMCDEYAVNDGRVTVIHKENGGVSDARNNGILAAHGKYLLFIDSDDFIAEDSLIKVAEVLEEDEETDVIFLNIKHYYDNGIVKDFNGFFNKDMLYKKDHMEVLIYLASLSDFTTSVCLKLIKRELLISNHILFEKIIWGEDTDFCMKLFLCAKTYNYCGSYIYYYRKERNGSATYSFSDKKFTDLLYVIFKWVKEAEGNPDYDKFSDVIYGFLAFQYCLLISGFNKISHTSRQKFKKEIKKYSWLFKKTKDRRVSIVGIVYNIFGLRLTSVALGIYENLRTKQ